MINSPDFAHFFFFKNVFSTIVVDNQGPWRHLVATRRQEDLITRARVFDLNSGNCSIKNI